MNTSQFSLRLLFLAKCDIIYLNQLERVVPIMFKFGREDCLTNVVKGGSQSDAHTPAARLGRSREIQIRAVYSERRKIMTNQCPQCGRIIRYNGLCAKCRTENEEKEILALSGEELAAKTAEVISNGFDEDMCCKLIRLRGINTEQLAKAAWEKRRLNFAPVYKDASESITSEMIAELLRDDTDSRTANNLLVCLAHRGGDTVLKAFRELEENPREWRKKLYVDPHVYANEGGWTFDGNGKVTETVFRKCYPVVRKTAEEREKSPVKLITPAEGTCTGCGTNLVNLIELDGRNERLKFLGIDGKIALKSCLNCIPYNEDGFVRFDLNGWSEIVPEKCYAEEADEPNWTDELTENTFALADSPMPEYFPFSWDTGSAVGGFPFWINDCIIKDCPDCGKPMICLAQLGEDAHGYDANVIIEVCRECKVAAVLYQQT